MIAGERSGNALGVHEHMEALPWDRFDRPSTCVGRPLFATERWDALIGLVIEEVLYEVGEDQAASSVKVDSVNVELPSVSARNLVTAATQDIEAKGMDQTALKLAASAVKV